MALRIAILGLVAIAVFCVLFFRLWALQVISGERYLEEAKNNQVRTFRVDAPRGPVLDRDGEVLVSNAPGTLVQLWPAALEQVSAGRRADIFARLSELLNVPLGEIRTAVREHRDDPLTAVTIKTSVHDEKAAYLLEHQAEFPGVQVTETQLRRYEQGSLAAHALGYVGEISDEQLVARDGKGYAAGDVVGQTGIEAAYDRYLRGTPGVGQVGVNALGEVTSAREFSQLPEPGNAVRLTIDADLQRAAADAIRFGIRIAHENGEWAANGGALVAMDPNTGEILALASHPRYDPSIWVGRRDPKKLAKLRDPRENDPAVNRAVAGVYPPGSTWKPITALAALQEGMLTATEPVQCTGSMEVDNQTFRNWNPYANYPLTLVRALAESCDTYFYDVALRFYEREDSPLQKWARQFGFGSTTGVDIGPEEEGLVPTPAWRERHFEAPQEKVWTSGDSVQLAIGQGDVLATPLQMTRFYALIANGGKLVEPHVVAAVEEPRHEGEPPVVLRPFAPKPPEDLGLSPAHLSVVREGLYDGANAPLYGTSAGVFGTFPVDVAGKTGTAEKFVKLPGEDTGRLRDQSWWCGYAPYEKPEIALCAVIENGGHGASAAAPAALQVLEAYFDVEATGVIDATATD